MLDCALYYYYMKPVGKVVHYYDRIGVAIIELSDTLRSGDQIKIKGAKTEFEQTVQSLQMEHVSVEMARAGQTVGLKIAERTNEGAVVYKTEE